MATSSSESVGLYGNTVNFGGTYFEWFIFQESATAPATPTGGSWNFSTNVGVLPAGWSTTPPANPTNVVWASISFVNSRSSSTLTWTTPATWVKPGTAGAAATITAGTTTTLSAGSPATVTNSGTSSAAVFNFGIPTGPTGAAGSAATVAVGTTTTGAPGSSATVTNAGTSSAAVLNFSVPAGQGVPSGGTTGQFLAKSSATNYDTSWITITGVLNYQGAWNASTNTPALASSVGTNGYYYVVSVAGSTSLNGISDWQIGDWAIFNGTVWQKIDQTNLVTSVNGQTGVVSLAYADLAGSVPTWNQNTTGNAANVTGTVAIINGGTGQTTRQDAMDALAGSTTSGQYLRGNGTDVVMSAIQSGDVPTLNQNTTGTAANVTGTVAIANGGTGQTTASAGFNALSPITTTGDLIIGNGSSSATRLGIGANGYLLTSNGTTATWTPAPSTGVTTFAGGTTGLTPASASSGAITLAGTLEIANGGTGQTTANTALNALLPAQTSNANKYLQTDGTNTSWDAVSLSTADITGTLPITNGGTGATTAGVALTNLGAVGTIASADASIVVTQVGSSVDLSVSSTSPASVLLEQVRNTTGATLTKGTAVYISGATGQIPTVSKALATSDATSAQTLGLITTDIANNANGYVTIIGLVTNLNTSAYTDGQQLYLSPTTAGTLTATKPYAPQHLVYMAVVSYAHPTQGKLIVKVQNGYELDEIHNVSAQSPTTGQTIVWNSATNLWEKNTVSLTAGVNGTLPVANGGTGVTTSTGTGSVVLSTSPTLVTPLLGTPTSGNFSSGTFTWPTFNQNTTGTAANVTGTVAIANGGTGQTTAATAITSLTGTQTSGYYLRSDGTNAALAAIQVADVPTLNQNTTGTAANVTGTVAVANGGTGQTTYTDGQVLIGNSTGNTLTKTTLTAGTGISISNGSGAITIAATNSGTVTSVTGTSPVVSSGGATPAISLASSYGDTQNPYASKTANYVLAAPNGSAGVPTFRAIVAADIPTLNQNTTGSAATATSATTATNLAGGIASQIPYQTAAGTTSFISNGTAGQILTSNGTSTPSWQAPAVSGVSQAKATAISLIFGL